MVKMGPRIRRYLEANKSWKEKGREEKKITGESQKGLRQEN